MPVPGTLFLGIQAFTVMVQFAFLKVLRMRPNAVEMRKQPKQRKKKKIKKIAKTRASLGASALQRTFLCVQKDDPTDSVKYCSFHFNVPEHKVILIYNYAASQVVSSHCSQMESNSAYWYLKLS